MAQAQLQVIKGLKTAPRTIRSRMDTVLLTPSVVDSWKLPPFQRPLRINDKVHALSEELKKNGGVLPGVLTLGRIGDFTYLVDGQHRIEAFKISGMKEGFADVRLCDFDTMADMGEEFVNLNQSIVKMRPDDVLRGLEATIPGLVFIRKHCEFVGYAQIRRGGTSGAVVSMSTVLRCWAMSAKDVPTSAPGSVIHLAKDLTEGVAHELVQFVNVAYGSWGRDPEYWRLWGALNLAVTMWLWRRTVLTQYSAKSVRLNVGEFGKCLMALSASADYLDWLHGRSLTDRDRAPCYSRIRSIFNKRLIDLGLAKDRLRFPAPAWSVSAPGRGITNKENS